MRLLPQLTYANVMSTLGVFLALGGVSYAAVKLPSNSVGTRQLRAGSVTTSKIAKKTRSALRGRAGASGPAGTAGPQGATGAQGPAGTPGADGQRGPSDAFVAAIDKKTLPAGAETQVVTLTVPAGQYVLSGRVKLRGQDDAYQGTCALLDGSKPDDANFATRTLDYDPATIPPAPSPYFGYTTLSLAGAASFPAETTVRLSCEASTDTFVADVRLFATEVGTLHAQLPLPLND